MDRMIYLAMTGAKNANYAQATNTNNLANVNTTGFRADFEQFRSMPVFGGGYASRVYSMTERPGTDFSGGGLQTTGRELDMAIADQGWIAVQGAEGREGFTRAGDFRVTPNGQLITSAGFQVMGDAGPMAIPPYDKLDIGDDGTITIIPQGQRSDNMVVVGRIKLVNPATDTITKGPDGLMYLNDPDAVAPPDAGVRVVQGALEMSNVNAVEAMVNMMQLSRHYELQVKMMKTAEEVDQHSAQLLRMS